ncbi:type II toxin-antitoxin system Phd/YefM family antitoxin [Luteimonas sp. SJ-92]|uniref:Type II toxin-antitoxin system Phd/YefM family antitoxin n=1 Tax=Luteimonas salinisoli TaxID=2752307 RepID=A0A853JGJ4_9GAMM|nr:type II toxin-antitoxin system Phd/YefM family antitoxin [Luteimonas salinisoli]NZA27709.1 type II toxin-antitoxin system Phd/YefM family antitoxin [Luteimonas salinisoli]
MRTASVVTIQRDATELLAEIARDRRPILIAHDGLPRAYLVDAETFQLMQRRLAILEGIAGGEQAIAEGRVATHTLARTKLRCRPADAR